jgi:LuxR family quorum sensing-dependent transcriptional regulator
MDPHREALEFAIQSQNKCSFDQLNEEFFRLISQFGFESFILTGLPAKGADVEPLVILNQWPEGWTDRYRAQNYFSDDPVSRWSLSRTRPFLWREAQRRDSSRRALQIAGEAWEHGLADGIAYPLRDSAGSAVISLASDYSFRADEYAKASLFMACSYYKMAVENLLRRPPPRRNLTRREMEILHWAANGKTAWETSEILSIAEATVKAHLATIREKLGVATTIQAVAIQITKGNLQL